jgi:hypothetical protein
VAVWCWLRQKVMLLRRSLYNRLKLSGVTLCVQRAVAKVLFETR